MERRTVLVGGIAAALMVTAGMIDAEAGVVVQSEDALPKERRRLTDALVVQFTRKTDDADDPAEAAPGVCKGCPAAARAVAPWFEAKLWDALQTDAQKGRLIQPLYNDPSGLDTHAKVMGVFRALPGKRVPEGVRIDPARHMESLGGFIAEERHWIERDWVVLLFIWDTSKGFAFPVKGWMTSGEYEHYIRDMGDTFFLAARVGGDPRTEAVTVNPVREITVHDDASVLG